MTSQISSYDVILNKFNEYEIVEKQTASIMFQVTSRYNLMTSSDDQMSDEKIREEIKVNNFQFLKKIK